jgi:hypothetical protein
MNGIALFAIVGLLLVVATSFHSLADDKVPISGQAPRRDFKLQCITLGQPGQGVYDGEMQWLAMISGIRLPAGYKHLTDAHMIDGACHHYIHSIFGATIEAIPAGSYSAWVDADL